MTGSSLLLHTVTCPDTAQLLQEFLEMGSLWDNRYVSVIVVVSKTKEIRSPRMFGIR